MNVLDLFSGVGGFSLGLERAGFHTVAFCEIDPYCRKVLKKHWPDVPIHEDIRTLDGTQFRSVDLVCGGFPCQPFSVAGKQDGSSDDRALWPEMLRVIREVQPTWVIGENVPGIINMELDNCLSNLEALGYSCQTFVIPACAVDAKHRRDRVWIMANAQKLQRNGGYVHREHSERSASGVKSRRGGGTQRIRKNMVGYAGGPGLEGWDGPKPARPALRLSSSAGSKINPAIWKPEPRMG